MANIIKIKRGTATPSTSSLSNVGEMAFDTTNEALYIRGNSSVVRVGVMELVKYYESTASSVRFNITFNANYIYKFHIVASTNTTDTSNSVIEYYSSSTTTTKANGAYVNIELHDTVSSPTYSSANTTGSFEIKDAYTNRVSATYATTKVIDFELSPTQEGSVTATYSWVVQGKSTTCSSDHSATPITMCLFSHAVDVSLNGININPGLDGGSTKTLCVSIYRMRRR